MRGARFADAPRRHPALMRTEDPVRLQNKVVGITGAGLGIGRACALAYAAEGARVAVTDIDVALARTVAQEIETAGGRAGAWSLDVTSRDEIGDTLAAIVAELGPIDVWHNNAGVSTMRAFVDLTEADWDFNMDVNAKGVFNCSQAVARYLIEAKRRGKIINTASMAGRTGKAPFLAHYVASKFAVVGMTQAMAAELAPFDIRVNSICPGFVVTSMQEREAAWEGSLRGMSADEVRRAYVEATPLGRLQVPEDVATVAVFLASADSDFMTGVAIDVNGGAWMS
jgi:NAD(P)-dependent dehydrogenase (short-subunit alcohol dehydrogenase family)